MRFLLLVTWDRAAMDVQEERAPGSTGEAEGFPWLDDLQARGKRVIGDQLAPPQRARTVRMRDDRAAVTDGPFVETKEAVGGFDLIEAEDIDEAVEIASRHPVAAFGSIEVRPLRGG
jgi:hypothetical protein